MPAAWWDALVAAACTALRRRRPQIEAVGSAWDRGPHSVRTGAELLSARTGTTLDVVVLLAGALERLGVPAVLLLTPKTALLGYWRDEEDAERIPASPQEAAELARDGTLGLVYPELALRRSAAALHELTGRVRAAALALSRKSLLSDTIREADKRRERLYVTLRNIVKAYRTYPVEAEAAAAQRLVQLLKDYALNPRMQRDAETGLMVHLLDDLAGPYAADVATLRIGPLVETLKEVNELLRDTTDRRANERSAYVVGRLKKARKAADRAYREFVRKVNALSVVGGAEDYAAFIDYVNTEVAHYRREVIPPRKKKEAALDADSTSAPADSGA